MRDQPNQFLMIIGAMKSGTSYLYDLLEQHPQICPCVTKEPCFFADPPDNDKFYLGMDYYKSLWPDYNNEQHMYAIDGSVNNTKIPFFPNAAERMASIKSAKFKFIYIMRNPVERIRSHVRFMEIYRRRNGGGGGDLKIDERAVCISQYARQISEYYKRFDKEDFRLLLFEEFIADPQTTCDQIFSFLNTDPFIVDIKKDKFATNEAAFPRALYQARQLIPFKAPLKKYLPGFVRKMATDKALKTWQLTESEKEKIINTLKPDLIRLRDEFGVNIDKWNLSI